MTGAEGLRAEPVTVTHFLRERRNDAERATVSSRYSPADRSRAIDVLRGCVLIVAHPYEADPYSGAGNCWCGRNESHTLHDVIVIEQVAR